MYESEPFTFPVHRYEGFPFYINWNKILKKPQNSKIKFFFNIFVNRDIRLEKKGRKKKERKTLTSTTCDISTGFNHFDEDAILNASSSPFIPLQLNTSCWKIRQTSELNKK